MTDNDLTGRLRSTTEQMANRCSVDARLWNVHSNVALEAADEIERLWDENERLKARLLESDALLSGLLDNESLAEYARASVIEQMQDNQKALGDD